LPVLFYYAVSLLLTYYRIDYKIYKYYYDQKDGQNMLFDYQYCVCSMAVTLLLILINYQRQSYYTADNKIFILMCIMSYLTACADLLTYFTISYPGSFKPWFLYAANYTYFILVTNLTMTFIAYTSQKIKNKKLNNIRNFLFVSNCIVLILCILTSAHNHSFIYFDEAMQYHHGRFLLLLFINPSLAITLSMYFFFIYRKQFSPYQIMIVMSTLLVLVFSIVLQFVYRNLDLSNFAVSMVLVAVFVCFEDPAQYTYLNTRCFNHRALLLEIKRRIRYSRTTVCLIAGIQNNPDGVYFESKDDYYAFTSQIANMMFKTFGQRVFAIDGSKYLIFIKTAEKKKEDEIRRKLEEMFAKPIVQRKVEIPVQYSVRSTSLDAVVRSESMANDLIFSLRSSTVDTIFNARDLAVLTDGLARERSVAEAVNRCIQDKGPTIQFQPIFDVKDGKFRSVEVLSRVKDNVLGDIRPSEFIPVAEKNGSIVQLGEQVFRKTCEFAAKHADDCNIDFFEVNVSQLQLKNPDFASRFIAIANEFGISPSLINLEFTESVEMISDSVIIRNISMLSDHRFGFSIDDYGSGFSAPSCLIKIPASLVKIDCTLLEDAATDNNAYIVLEHSVELMKKLGKQVVIEGAETEADVNLAVGTGADYIQGYFYSKPLDEEAFVGFCKSRV